MKEKMTLEEWKSNPRIGELVFTYLAETKRWESGKDEFHLIINHTSGGWLQGTWFACLLSGETQYAGGGDTPAEALYRAADDLRWDADRAAQGARLILAETEKGKLA